MFQHMYHAYRAHAYEELEVEYNKYLELGLHLVLHML